MPLLTQAVRGPCHISAQRLWLILRMHARRSHARTWDVCLSVLDVAMGTSGTVLHLVLVGTWDGGLDLLTGGAVVVVHVWRLTVIQTVDSDKRMVCLRCLQDRDIDNVAGDVCLVKYLPGSARHMQSRMLLQQLLLHRSALYRFVTTRNDSWGCQLGGK